MRCHLKSKPKLVYKDRLERFSDAHWLIWSNKWGCWYRSDSSGYTSDIAQAGIYDRATAALHYDGPDRPKACRDTEPFPVSSVRRHIDLCEREIEASYEQAVANIYRLRQAMEPTP